MRTPAQFYYKPDDPFGSPRPGTGRTHRGADWAYPAGTPIPSWISGTVVFNDWYGELGWVLAAKRADGLVAGWCHLEERSSLPVGSRLAYGAYIGADTGDTGSASTGPHLHGTASWSSINPGAGEVVDPWPLILQSLTLTQGEEEMQHWIHPPTGKEIPGRSRSDGVSLPEHLGEGLSQGTWLGRAAAQRSRMDPDLRALPRDQEARPAGRRERVDRLRQAR